MFFLFLHPISHSLRFARGVVLYLTLVGRARATDACAIAAHPDQMLDSGARAPRIYLASTYLDALRVCTTTTSHHFLSLFNTRANAPLFASFPRARPSRPYFSHPLYTTSQRSERRVPRNVEALQRRHPAGIARALHVTSRWQGPESQKSGRQPANLYTGTM